MSKRKAEEHPHTNGAASKKRAVENGHVEQNFRDGLFDKAILDQYTSSYAKSEPYKYGVIRELMNEDLLRAVRSEILQQINFTPKETDIYRIHQSGDLANLDGLDNASLARLPSLLKLRDALYSSAFRGWISHVGNAGSLSGKKTDMAINVYTPGCHLLCHDDVIGSRRLSYILYLTDPDEPWQPEWGGALRLYPTTKMKAEDGTEVIVPSAEFSSTIPPSWNQLSFFTIQPGLSFHDVEEVYHRKEAEGDDSLDGGRIRMAISGWFHIPQEGEEGYEEGLEEKLAAKSSLTQLQQSTADQFDLPQPRWHDITASDSTEDDEDWTADELDFLVRFINPTYLVPDTLEELSENFQESSVITLTNFLHPKFEEKLKEYVSKLDRTSPATIPASSSDPSDTGIARPPHKSRFLYRHAASIRTAETESDTPLDQLLDLLLPSQLFARWLRLLTNVELYRSYILARRFRRGLDYTLATGYEGSEPQLEISFGLTPTDGWSAEADDDEDSEDGVPAKASVSSDEEQLGGYEVYMVGDEDDEEYEIGEASATGAGNRGSKKADPAVYKASSGEDDDGVLFSMPASWNTLSIVLRDKGLLKFVKYVSASAKGDRWDISGTFGVRPDDEDEDEDAEEGSDEGDDV